MNEPNYSTDNAGVQRWLQEHLSERARPLRSTHVEHLLEQSLDACRRGRLTAACALMLAAENL